MKSAFAFALGVLLMTVRIAPAQEKNCTPVVIPGVKGNATTSKFGDGYVTRSSDGKVYTTSRFGGGWITRGSDGQTFTTSKFGDGAITRGNNGDTVTTSRFGSGVISRSSSGATTTTSRFANGTISRSSSGGSATTSRFGSGFTTSQNAASRDGAGTVLVIPQTARGSSGTACRDAQTSKNK